MAAIVIVGEDGPSRENRQVTELPTIWDNRKLRRIMIIGVLMALYSSAEIGISIYVNSLVMFSDGLHNASDGLALLVAFWAEKMKLSPAERTLTYGYRRMEILGGFVNGIFLLCIAVFVALQAIPLFVHTVDVEPSRLELIMYLAAAGTGIVINIIGVTLFADTHTHGGQECHGHGGGGGGGPRKIPPAALCEKTPLLSSINGEGGEFVANEPAVAAQAAAVVAAMADHGHHSHGHGDHSDHNAEADSHRSHGHSHGHGGGEQHGVHGAGKRHDDTDGHSHTEGHSHGHGGGEKHGAHGACEGHAHAHSPAHTGGGGYETHGHGHSHGAHDHGVDHNMWGLFAHFLGDVFTSILVLCTGLVYWFEGESAFAPYADPVCSLLSAAIIFTTGWGVTKAAGWILLQAAPSGINTTEVSTAILDIDDVVDVHEMHVWQLVDNLSLATCHIVIREGCSVKRINSVIDDVRSVFHKFKIHVSTIQQEVDSSQRRTALGECIVSKSGCVADCDAESCCPDEVSQAKAEAIALRRRRLTAAETAAAPEVR